jgi:DNA-binding transcriptional MerR regulator
VTARAARTPGAARRPARRASPATAKQASRPDPELALAREVAQLLGVTRRQLQYWAKTDLVRPSYRTRGGHHRYTFRDLVALKATKRLIDAGVSVQRIRKSIDALKRVLPHVAHPLSELVLVATGDVVLVLREGSAFEAVSGQEWVFEVAQLQRDVAALRERSRRGI